ncbi:MAG: EAL domain-containing protein, partial [Bacillota bacterium]|nr:EAL domain-containing protein [Bacillota bacterium]
ALKFIKEEDIPRSRAHFLRALKGKEQFYDLEIANINGDVQLFQMKNIPITVNGEAIGIYGIGRNITEQKKIEEKITQMAYYDFQTGLPNRMKMTELLDEMIKRASKKKRLVAVLFIDIDRFKIINDSLGHSAGDFLLKELAARVQQLLPSGAYLGRFSGDKFTLILTKNVNEEEVLKTATMVIEEISNPFFFAQKEFFVTASIGVSLYPKDGKQEQELFKNADISLNRSKNSGGNRITFFTTEMNEEAMMRLELESYLRKALKKDEFFLCYQPLIDLETGKVYGSEALIRWNHPKLGLVSPADFIPLAEETGLIGEIGNWVLRSASKQNKVWQDKGFRDLSIAVNVSAYQFQQPNFLDEVKLALAESSLDPQFLTLELTESAMLRNIEYSILTMKALQELGVKVSIDDFGTGYSSLSYLRNLPINTLKIDRSFINNLSIDTTDIAIVKAIITMGHGLSVKVVAEGVETKEQIELLKDLNCHYAQGFYLNRPLVISDFEDQLGLEKGLLLTP